MAKVQYKNADFFKGRTLDYGVVATPYGEALLVMDEGYLVALAFVESTLEAALEDIKRRLKAGALKQNHQAAAPVVEKIKQGKAVPLILSGTPFFSEVWRALLEVPRGETLTYGALAAKAGNPKAARAVGSAMNQNKIAWAVPCHRVVARDSSLHGYRYGLEIKEKLLAAEGINVTKLRGGVSKHAAAFLSTRRGLVDKGVARGDFSFNNFFRREIL